MSMLGDHKEQQDVIVSHQGIIQDFDATNNSYSCGKMRTFQSGHGDIDQTLICVTSVEIELYSSNAY